MHGLTKVISLLGLLVVAVRAQESTTETATTTEVGTGTEVPTGTTASSAAVPTDTSTIPPCVLTCSEQAASANGCTLYVKCQGLPSRMRTLT